MQQVQVVKVRFDESMTDEKSSEHERDALFIPKKKEF
jgi:hypothetical protein